MGSRWSRCAVRFATPSASFRVAFGAGELKDKNVVMQVRDYSCGAASLCTLLRYYWGDDINEQRILNELDKMLSPAER